MMYFEKSQLHIEKCILSRLEDLEPCHEGFSKLLNGEKLKGNISQLFDEESVLYKDKINCKMPDRGVFKAHQDVQAGWDRYSKLHITALVSIDPSTLENGCLEMVASQHKQGLIGEQSQPLDEDALNYVLLPTAPGDAVFFDSFAPHRSKPNLANKARRVLCFTDFPKAIIGASIVSINALAIRRIANGMSIKNMFSESNLPLDSYAKT
jgi:hypothetical protein